MLSRQLGFYRPLEERLLGLPIDATPPFAPAGRACRLELDLRDLGLTPEVVARLPICSELPALESLDEVAGCVYVIEGAALGGRVIAKVARERLGLDRVGLRFFGGDTAIGPRWHAVLAWLEAIETHGGDPELVCASACATFDALARWLARGERGA